MMAESPIGNSRHPAIHDLIESASADFAEAGLRIDSRLIARLAASLIAKRFAILTGVSGSGKSRLAQSLAIWLSQPTKGHRPRFNAGSYVRADRISYYVHDVDRLSTELWNSEDPSTAIRVSLPWTLIDQWADCIVRHQFTRDTPTRTIRTLVHEEVGQYSAQLNSFETQLKAAAFAIIESGYTAKGSSTYEVIPVGADWTSNEQVLGYRDALQPTRYVRTPILNLLLRAAENPAIPHFLILDEMNLSHVERYFSDFLSAMESGEPIHLYDDEAERVESVPSSLPIPDNLFVVGTVNVDETTYQFSPKVLDRANTIEFRVAPDDVLAFMERPTQVSLDSLVGKGATFAPAIMSLSRTALQPRDADAKAIRNALSPVLEILADTGAEFGFRTGYEIARFIEAHRLLVNASSGFDFMDAIDAQIYQKILPKLNGSRSQLEPTLLALAVICLSPRNVSHQTVDSIALLTSARESAAAMDTSVFDPSDSLGEMQFPLSFAKLRRMYLRLEANGFTSFAEA